ncbi:hypothetical protein [Streptomyces phytohabitans]|uniref:hypothetical protein n=1 Tax=Streptomyces phytohabitans TaxID=1150371 RepID=UPI00345BE25A
MTDAQQSSRSHVTNPRGPVHAGTGDQTINLIFDAAAAAWATSQHDPKQIAEDELRQLKQVFVWPPDFARARTTLHDWNTVFVVGRPGTGRQGASKVLLGELPTGKGTFHEIVDESEERNGPLLPKDLVGEEDRLLLDLTQRTEERCRAYLGELPHFRTVVRNRNARLAVALDHGHEHLLSPELSRLKVSLGRPRAEEVLRRHLRVHEVDGADCLTVDTALRHFLDEAALREIAALALRVREEQRTLSDAASRPGLARCLERALTTPRPYDSEVAEIVSEADSEQRALLLAAACLKQPRSDTLCLATALLLKTAGQPTEGLYLLHHAALGSRLRQLKAYLDSTGRVRFREDKFATAVVAYFWDNFPPFRYTLRSWMTGVIKKPWLTEHDRLAIAAAYATQRLRTGHPRDLEVLATRWSSDTSTPEQARLPAATLLLGQGVRDDAHGGYFREAIYRIVARPPGPDVPMAHVLIGVCSETMATHHPHQALVRLHHLARHRSAEVRGVAGDSLAEVTHGDDRLYRRLLDRVTSGPPASAYADAELFVRLSELTRLTAVTRRATAPLLVSASFREQLVDGWRLVFSHLRHETYAARVRQWLDIPAAWAQHLDSLLDVLVRGAGEDAAALARLYDIAARWALHRRTPTSRRETVLALRQRIDAAQGITSAVPPPSAA